MFLLFICGTYSQRGSPAPPQPRHIWGAGEGGNVTHGPQKQHPWGTRASPSTPVGSQPQLGASRGGTRGSMLAIQAVMGTRWPWGQVSPCSSSHPLAKSHSRLVRCQVRLGSTNFSVGAGKATRSIQWHRCAQGHRATAPGAAGVPRRGPPGLPGGRVAGAGGLVALSAAAGAISIPETRLHPLNKKQTRN